MSATNPAEGHCPGKPGREGAGSRRMREPEDLPRCASRQVFEGKAVKGEVLIIPGLLLGPGIFYGGPVVYRLREDHEVSCKRAAQIMDLVRSTGSEGRALETRCDER